MFTHLRALASYMTRELLPDERGAGVAEYVLLIGFIAVMIIGVVVAFRGTIGDALTNAGNSLQNFK